MPCNTDARSLEAAITQQAANYRGLLNSRGMPNPRTITRQTIEDVQHWALQKPASALMLIGPGEQGLCAWVWQRNKVAGFLLSTAALNNNSIVSELRTMNLSGRGARAVVQEAPLRNVRESLRSWQEQWLPAPMKAALSRASEVVILPSGGLAQLPWNALMIQAFDGEGSVPSVVIASDFKSALELRLHWEPISANDKVLAVGNPDYGGELPQLPGAQAEAQFYARTFNVEALIGAQATVARVSKALEEADIAFLATHGFADPEQPLKGGALALTGGRLTAEAIQSMSFKKKSVIVLSACETGLGQSHAAGTIGLARAFQLAGAVGVIMSLWSVDDQATQTLMQYFVEELKTAAPSQALLRAQIRLKSSHPDPRHWGAFNYFGAPVSKR